MKAAIVIRLDRQPHPKGDKMFVQHLPDGRLVCGSIAAWEGRELAVHIPPDLIVDTERSEFDWLKDPKIFNPASEGETRYHKVKEALLRSVLSYGFMAEAPEGSKEGDDVTERLGIKYGLG